MSTYPLRVVYTSLRSNWVLRQLLHHCRFCSAEYCILFTVLRYVATYTGKCTGLHGASV